MDVSGWREREARLPWSGGARVGGLCGVGGVAGICVGGVCGLSRVGEVELDRALNGLCDSLLAIVRSFKGPRAAMAQSLLDACFPQGVGLITRLPYVDQHAAVQRLLGLLRAPEHSAAVASLYLQEWVALLEQLNQRYGELLVRPERLSPASVAAADKEGWVSMLSVVALVLGLFPTDSEADRTAREALLQPIEEQEEALAALRARRRGEGPPVDLGSDEGDFPEPADPPEVDAV